MTKPKYKIVNGEPVCDQYECDHYTYHSALEKKGCEISRVFDCHESPCIPGLREQRDSARAQLLEAAETERFFQKQNAELREQRDQARVAWCERVAQDRNEIRDTLSKSRTNWETIAQERGWTDLYDAPTTPVCIDCNNEIIDECGVFDAPEGGELCRSCHEKRFEVKYKKDNDLDGKLHELNKKPCNTFDV